MENIHVTIPVYEYKRLKSLDNDSNRLELDDEGNVILINNNVVYKDIKSFEKHKQKNVKYYQVERKIALRLFCKNKGLSIIDAENTGSLFSYDISLCSDNGLIKVQNDEIERLHKKIKMYEKNWFVRLFLKK